LERWRRSFGRCERRVVLWAAGVGCEAVRWFFGWPRGRGSGSRVQAEASVAGAVALLAPLLEAFVFVGRVGLVVLEPGAVVPAEALDVVGQTHFRGLAVLGDW
jgi:hypothetical protein